MICLLLLYTTIYTKRLMVTHVYVQFIEKTTAAG